MNSGNLFRVLNQSKLMMKPSMTQMMVRNFYYPDANHHHLNQEVSKWFDERSECSPTFLLRESSRLLERDSDITILKDGKVYLWHLRQTGTVKTIALTLRLAYWSMTPSNVNSTSISTTERSCCKVSKIASISSCPSILLSEGKVQAKNMATFLRWPFYLNNIRDYATII